VARLPWLLFNTHYKYPLTIYNFVVPYFTILFWYLVLAGYSNFSFDQCRAEMKENNTHFPSSNQIQFSDTYVKP